VVEEAGSYQNRNDVCMTLGGQGILRPTAISVNNIHLDYWRVTKKGFRPESCEVPSEIVRRQTSWLKKGLQRLSPQRTLTDRWLARACVWVTRVDESSMSLFCHIESFRHFSTDVTRGRGDPTRLSTTMTRLERQSAFGHSFVAHRL
jgi:hypothetical protein